MKPPLVPSADVDLLDQQVPFAGRTTLRIVDFRHRRFNGTWSHPIRWELWQRGVAAAVLPYDPRTDHVVLIEQFRLPAYAAGFAPIMREVPAGFCDPNEDAEAAARRELMEETGLTVGRTAKIGAFMLSPGGSDEVVVLYAGEVAAPDQAAANAVDLTHLRDHNEDIRILVLPTDQAIAAAIDGEVPNSIAAIALLWLAARREALRAAWR